MHVAIAFSTTRNISVPPILNAQGGGLIVPKAAFYLVRRLGRLDSVLLSTGAEKRRGATVCDPCPRSLFTRLTGSPALAEMTWRNASASASIATTSQRPEEERKPAPDGRTGSPSWSKRTIEGGLSMRRSPMNRGIRISWLNWGEPGGNHLGLSHSIFRDRRFLPPSDSNLERSTRACS